MQSVIKIVGLGGSLRQPSTSLAALKIALEGAQEAGAEIELFDVRELDLPMYTPGMQAPEAATRLAEAACSSQGMLWSSPLYHGTVSGAFKNALDWLDLLRVQEPPFLKDKIIGLISTAGGTQGLQAINTMEYAVRALRAWAVPLVMPVGQAAQSFDEDGSPRDVKIVQSLHTLGSEVVRASRQFAVDGYCDYSISTHARY
jgi:FMN reductase